MRPYRNKGAKGHVLFERIPGDDLDDEDGPPAWVRRAVAPELRQIEGRFGRLQRAQGQLDVIAGPLGCGVFGCAFALEGNRVLKVTSDEDEGPAAWRMWEYQQRSQRAGRIPVLAATAKINGVFRLRMPYRSYGETTACFGIVRERVGESGEGVSSRLGRAANLYTDGWDAWATAEGRPGRLLGVAMARAGLDMISEAPGGANVAAVLRYVWKEGFPLMDVHRYNLALRERAVGPGTKRGQVVLFDFGGSTSCPLPGPQDVVQVQRAAGPRTRPRPQEIPTL